MEKNLKKNDNTFWKAYDLFENENEFYKMNFDPSSKEDLFYLGMIFASNKKLSLMNKNELEKLRTNNKSFTNMVLYWDELNLSSNLSVTNNKKNIFLICPVRNATQKQIEDLNKYISEKESLGYHIHYPARDTNQTDDIGYRICLDNSNAIASSNTVCLFYDKLSTGSCFDLGVAFYLMHNNRNRNFILINNDVKLEPYNFIDASINDMMNMSLFKNTETNNEYYAKQRKLY